MISRMNKAKDNPIVVESDPDDPTVIIVNGKKYCGSRIKLEKIDGVPHVKRMYFKELDEEQHKKDMSLVVNTLKNKTDAGELLTEILKEVPPRIIKRLAKRIKEKKPIKKHHGCLGFKIGDAYLNISGGFAE